MDIGHLDLSHAFFNPITYFETVGTEKVDVCNQVDAFLNPGSPHLSAVHRFEKAMDL